MEANQNFDIEELLKLSNLYEGQLKSGPSATILLFGCDSPAN
jgi:hypothetical protein